MQYAPALPASLKAFRLESGDDIDLEWLAYGDGLVSAAEGLAVALVVSADVIRCKQWGLWDGVSDLPVCSRPMSMLPAGISALELHAPCVSLTYLHGAARFQYSPASAAFLLCIHFALAPPSYRRFSLSWTDAMPLSLRFVNRTEPWPGGSIVCKPMVVAFDAAEALAEHMRGCAGRLNMSVTVIKEGETNRVDVFRL